MSDKPLSIRVSLDGELLDEYSVGVTYFDADGHPIPIDFDPLEDAITGDNGLNAWRDVVKIVVKGTRSRWSRRVFSDQLSDLVLEIVLLRDQTEVASAKVTISAGVELSVSGTVQAEAQGQPDPLRRLEAEAFADRYPAPGAGQAVPDKGSFDGRGVRRRVNSRYFDGD